MFLLPMVFFSRLKWEVCIVESMLRGRLVGFGSEQSSCCHCRWAMCAVGVSVRTWSWLHYHWPEPASVCVGRCTGWSRSPWSLLGLAGEVPCYFLEMLKSRRVSLCVSSQGLSYNDRSVSSPPSLRNRSYCVFKYSSWKSALGWMNVTSKLPVGLPFM